MNRDLMAIPAAALEPEFTPGWVPVFARHAGAARGRGADAGINPAVISALLLACLAVNFLDIVTTLGGLLMSPDIQERNPFAQGFLFHYGIAGGIALLALVKLGMPLAVFVLLRQGRSWYRSAFFAGLCINTTAVLCAVANNCGVFFAAR